MKAVVFHQHGGLEQLRLEEVATPTPGPGEVLVRVKACALNHLDIWIRQGMPAYTVPLPHISGCDVAGVVEAVTPSLERVGVGDRVFVSPGLSCWRCRPCLSGRDNLCPSFGILGALRDGGYAEYVTVPALNVLPIPGALSFEEAAAFPLVSVTAWHMLFGLAGLQPGESVLVMGAGSGVGSMAVQMAKVAGARVMTTVGSEEKVSRALALGADEVADHLSDNLIQKMKSFTEDRGFDVVIEHIGPAVWDSCLRALAKGGRLVTCGATTGPEVKLDLRLLFSRQLTVTGSYMGTRAELLEAAAMVGRGAITPVVDRMFPLQEAREAQAWMLDRKVFGKIVLTVP